MRRFPFSTISFAAAIRSLTHVPSLSSSISVHHFSPTAVMQPAFAVPVVSSLMSWDWDITALLTSDTVQSGTCVYSFPARSPVNDSTSSSRAQSSLLFPSLPSFRTPLLSHLTCGLIGVV